ncbi:MAG: response regulator transcription factor [Cytophagaceae bacterium]|nr:MAG: response regulator transcription factor [Cytophagaceae bacterium]
MIRLFLVDDHPLVRSGLRLLLAQEPDLEVVGEAGHGQDLLDQLPATPADVVLLDLHMPVLDGLATTKRLRTEFPSVKVLVLSLLGHEHSVGQLFAAGAGGYILKSDELMTIALAIRTVATGRQYLCSELGLLLHKFLLLRAKQSASPAHNPYAFSPREFEILRLLAEGLTTSAIAGQLRSSRRTIETLRQHLLDKSKARNVAMLIQLVMAQGILP